MRCRAAIESETGVRPRLSTSGGTSDGRFLAGVAREVVEFGPLNDTIHKIDERVRVVGPRPPQSHLRAYRHGTPRLIGARPASPAE